MYTGIHVKYPLSCTISMKLEYSKQNLTKILTYEM